MIRRTALALCLVAGMGHAENMADQAARAASGLKAAVEALEAATEARDRVAALTQTIRAYEEGLAALRSAMRDANQREATLSTQFQAKRDRLARLVGVLARIEENPAPLLLLHPDGPLGTARSGMILAEVTPALQAEVQLLKAEMQELADLRALQISAADTLSTGLVAAQEARIALSQAISERRDLPRRFTEDPEALQALLNSAETMESFAEGLSLNLDDRQDQTFTASKGTLPLPVLGTVIRLPDEADAAGVRRPGLTLATRPGAIVTTPWPATIRYRGPLLDYGNVMIIEPGDGYLLVLAGLQTVYGEVGDVVPGGGPLGLMGGTEPASAEFTAVSDIGSGPSGTETLYMELRQGAAPVNPVEWFADIVRTGD
jgi:murein hydrolase activator